MKLTREQELLLGLSSREAILLEVLEHRPTHLSDLAKVVNLPRSTVEYTMKGLHKRGWVTYRSRSNARIWSVAPGKKFEQALSDLSQPEKNRSVFQFAGSQFGDVLRITPTLGIEYQIYSGVTALSELLGTLPNVKQKQFHGIANAKVCEQSFQKLSIELVADINHALLKNKIISHSILTQDYYHQGLQIGGLNWLQSFSKRLETTYIVPNYVLPFSTHIQIVDDRVYLIHWDKEVALEICDPDIVQMYHTMFRLWQGHGKRLYVRDHIQKLSSQRSQ